MACLLARGRVFLLFTLAMTLSSAQAITIYQDDFSGAGALNGATPDVGANNWVAGPSFNADGSIVSAGTGGSATLAFTPVDGRIYTLDASLTGVTATDNSWLGFGFGAGQSVAEGTGNRFINANVIGKAWMFHRGDANLMTNNALLGSATSGTAGSAPWSPAFSGGGDIDLRVVLDTTGGTGGWTATWFAKLPASGTYSEVRPEATLLNETINSVGVVYSSANVDGNIASFLLDEFVPPPPNQWNVDGGGSFNTAGNWLDNVVPTGTALFAGVLTEANAPAVVTLDAPASVAGVTFQNPNTYTIDGPSTLTLTGEATISASSGVHEISTQIAGNSGLTKTGGGIVTLSNGSNSYTGDTTVSSGTLNVTSLGALNQSSGVTNVAAGAQLQFNGDGEGNGASGTLTEQITGDGTVRLATGLTTEAITVSTANSSFNGAVSIAGGKLVVANANALGTADNTAATGTSIGGGANLDQGTLELAGVTVVDERLELVGRQPGETGAQLTSTGTSEWTGTIVGAPGGNQFNIESQSGTLTISGNITLPDSSERFLNLSGAGNGRIEGLILDRTLAEGDGAENASISLVKKGSGTWTIATTPPPEVMDPPSTARDGYHQRRTVIEEGTLAVQATGGTAGELFSETIEVASGATFDISSFTNYSLQAIEDPDGTLSTGDETGQTLTGAGEVNVGGTLQAFDDSTIAPGDSVGTLTINGNFVYSTFANTPSGAWNYELGSSTATGDRLLVNGTATINAGASSNVIRVNVSPVEGTLATGAYTLVQANSRGGSASNNTYVEAVFDAQGNDITADMRQTVSVANSGNNVVLNVAGTSANLNWAGTSGSAWDVQTTSNWTGSGGPQFSQLDNVTFGNVANKNVTVNEDVAPGSVTFNGGGGSTYTVTGSGGMTGFGDVAVNSGTVRLNNAGNAYAGTTTIASGARLEMNTAATGDMVINGTLSVGGAGVATGGAQTFFADNFNGANATPLNGTTPDTTFGGANWVAAPTFEADGDSVTGTGGGSATLAFTPADGSTYVLETSISNIVGDTDWFALGFANGQSAANSSNSRFLTGTVEGVAWAMYRGVQVSGMNQAFRGDPSLALNGGQADGAAWLVDGSAAGGDVALRITLDTTGGPGNWTATWEADTGSGFQTIRATEGLLSEAINSIGIANSNSADITGTIESFSLTGTEPANARLSGQTVTVDGDLVMGANSTLEFDIALVGQDFVGVTGAATLDGTIDVTKLGSFTPAGGAQYTLLSAAGGITDLGVSYILPSGFSASIVDMTDLVIAFGLQGDFNGDGIVNLGDYTVWRDNLGGNEGDGVLSGNGNGGIVDATDYQLWKANFGNGAAASAGLTAAEAAVPEPATWLTLIMGFALWSFGRKRLATVRA